MRSRVFKQFFTCFQRFELFCVLFQIHLLLKLLFQNHFIHSSFLWLISSNESSIDLNSFFLSDFSCWSFASRSRRITFWLFSISKSVNVNTQISRIQSFLFSSTSLRVQSFKHLLNLMLRPSLLYTSNERSFRFLKNLILVLSFVNVKFHSRVKLTFLVWLNMGVIFIEILNECLFVFEWKFILIWWKAAR